MIVYQKTTWLQLLFTFKGSILGAIKYRLLGATLFALLITWLMWESGPVQAERLSLTSLPFALIGLALAIFLGFRNNSSYDRFWEGRKLWGSLINTTRTLTRQIQTLSWCGEGCERSEAEAAQEASFEREQIRTLIAYVHALRHHLRGEASFEDAAPHLSAEEHAQMLRDPNPPIMLLDRLGHRFADAWRRGWINTLHLPVLESTLTTLTDIQGGCERIKKTPIPFAYTVLMHRIVAVYCFTLPLGIYTTVGLLTPLVVLLISYGFFGLDAIGDEIEEPFGLDPNDLSLTAFTRMLEIECRARLGETVTLKPLEPVDHVLS